jgi:hypothetical protein
MTRQRAVIADQRLEPHTALREDRIAELTCIDEMHVAVDDRNRVFIHGDRYSWRIAPGVYRRPHEQRRTAGVARAGHRDANLVEHLLSALMKCMTTTMAYHATSRGVEIRGDRY